MQLRENITLGKRSEANARQGGGIPSCAYGSYPTNLTVDMCRELNSA